MKLSAIYKMWSWTCAIRFNNEENTSLLDDRNTPFTVIPNTGRYWCADPFLFEKDGQLYLFFEAFDILKRKGVLGYRTITDGLFGDIHVIYECDAHLSFPFIYENKGDLFIIPESAKSGELFRLKCTRFPDQWEKDAVLLNETVVDTVRYVSDADELFVTEIVDEQRIYNRVDLFYAVDGQLIASVNNPVKSDASSARGAGALCRINGRLIRPSQDCADSYGERLNLNEVKTIGRDCLEEECLYTFSYRDIPLQQKIDVDGIHTYNKLGCAEVIDLRIPGKFNWLYTVGFLKKIIDKMIKSRR